MRVVVEMIDPEAFKPAGGEDPPRELNFKLATLNYPRLLVRNVLLTFIQTWVCWRPITASQRPKQMISKSGFTC